MNWISQGMDSCCFVYAVANFQVWRGVPLPDLEEAKDIGLCCHGSTLRHKAVVDFFKAPLDATEDAGEVLRDGGVITIHHPIWNGHSFCVFPTDRGITAVNSWLGPLVAEGLGDDELLQFVSDHYGPHWCNKSGT